MKKLSMLVMALLLLPMVVFAAEDEPKVLTVTTEVEKEVINYTGTTEEGVSAVMCKLFNAKDEEIDMLSSAVEEKAFSGSFTVTETGTYNVYCARYEGGEIQKAEAVVTEVTAPETATNPKTLDAGIGTYIAILAVSAIGIYGATVYLKKRKSN